MRIAIRMYKLLCWHTINIKILLQTDFKCFVVCVIFSSLIRIFWILFLFASCFIVNAPNTFFSLENRYGELEKNWIKTEIKFSYFCGETSIRVGCTGRSRNCRSASYDAANSVDEARLSSSNWSIKKNSEVLDVLVFRTVFLHIVKIFLVVSIQIGPKTIWYVIH